MKAGVVGLTALFVAACNAAGGGPFVIVGGVYRGTVTNDFNTCSATWSKGMVSDATMTIVQMDANVTVQVDGQAGAVLQATLGTSFFTGFLTGNHIDANIAGTVVATRGGCVYTSNAELGADLGGDILTGVIIYTPQTNGHADCALLQVNGCSGKQTFGVTRKH
jgi:hypothetical protein